MGYLIVVIVIGVVLFVMIKKKQSHPMASSVMESNPQNQRQVRIPAQKPFQYSVTDNIFVSTEFIGPCSQSPNGKYILVCDDSSKNLGGNRASGNGVFFVLKEGVVIFKSRSLQRPNEGKISNSGIYALPDWLFGDRCASEIHFFDDNRELFHIAFEANILRVDLSDNGAYAIIQTAYNNSDDGNILTFVDIERKKTLWKQPNHIGWATTHIIDIPKQEIVLDLGRYRYRFDFSGKFLDEDLYRQERELRANGYELIEIAREMQGQGNASGIVNTEKVLRLLSKAVTMDISENTKAFAFRQMGEICLEGNRKQEAIEFFEKALSWNRKIGLKRRLTQLKKEVLGTSNA